MGKVHVYIKYYDMFQFISVSFFLFTFRDQRHMNYWGGGDPDSSGCACDLDKSCVDPDFVCNCDKNDNVLREDSGYLTSKDDLPMFGFYAGDTGTYTKCVRTYYVDRLSQTPWDHPQFSISS